MQGDWEILARRSFPDTERSRILLENLFKWIKVILCFKGQEQRIDRLTG